MKYQTEAELKSGDPVVRFWITQIAPSCVFRHHYYNMFTCVLCDVQCKYQPSMIRHYREQHFHKMPAAIFGPLHNYACFHCNCNFRRHEHLDFHMQTIAHSNKVLASVGSDALIDRKSQLKFGLKVKPIKKDEAEDEAEDEAQAQAQAQADSNTDFKNKSQN